MYLFDTSAVSVAVDPRSPKHASIQTLMGNNSLFADEVFLSTVTISEMQMGLEMLKHREPPPRAQRLEDVRRKVELAEKLGTILPATVHVAAEHAALKVAYARKFAPNKLKGAGLKSKPVELWHDGIKASTINVDENDLWIAATALTHDLILVTDDRDYERMKDADLRLKILLL